MNDDGDGGEANFSKKYTTIYSDLSHVARARSPRTIYRYQSTMQSRLKHSTIRIDCLDSVGATTVAANSCRGLSTYVDEATDEDGQHRRCGSGVRTDMKRKLYQSQKFNTWRLLQRLRRGI